MAKRATELTRQDLRVYLAQRNTDTPDGGGKMTATALTGKPNELFPPVSDVDSTLGAFDVRLVYPAVLRQDRAALWGANVILSSMPKMKNVSYLLFKADFYGQERDSIMRRVEAYAAPTVETRMTLMGTQLKGSRLVQAYQRPEAPLPLVGQRYCLQYIINNNKYYEYFRIESLTDELRTFELPDGKEIVRRVISITTQSPLEHDFDGVAYASLGYADAPVKILGTQVADSARYYGIRPIAEPIVAGTTAIQIDTIYEKLVPTSTIETAHVDDFGGGRPVWIPIAPRQQIATEGSVPDNNLYFGISILPASIEMEGWTDTGKGQLRRGNDVLTVDYRQGIISGFNQYHYTPAITAIPAARFANYAYSAVINVDETNQGTEFAPFLRPRPALGSVAVAFRANGDWYSLNDNGNGFLYDVSGDKRGVVNPQTGSVTLSLPVQPDVGSKIILTWSPIDFYKTFDGNSVGSASTPLTVSGLTELPERPRANLKPSTIKLTWNDGSDRQATDSNGKLIGSCQGRVDYSLGKLYPVNLNSASVRLQAEQYSGTAEHKEVSVTQDNNGITIHVGAVVQAGTLALQLEIGRRESNSQEIVYEQPKYPPLLATTS